MKKKNKTLTTIDRLNNIGNGLDFDIDEKSNNEKSVSEKSINEKLTEEKKPIDNADNFVGNMINDIIKKDMGEDTKEKSETVGENTANNIKNKTADKVVVNTDEKVVDETEKVGNAQNVTDKSSDNEKTDKKINNKKGKKINNKNDDNKYEDKKAENDIENSVSENDISENDDVEEADFIFDDNGSYNKTLLSIVGVLAILFLLAALADQAKLRQSYTLTENAEEMDDETTETTTLAEEVYSPNKYTDVSKLTNDEIAKLFYSNTVFVGDSLTVGFSNYAALSDSPEFLKDITYLAAVNYGTYNALKPVEGNNVHPIYKGESVAVCDAVAEIKPDRIFINLGINELSGSNAIQRTVYNYCQLVYNLKLSSPDSKIYVVSVSPMTKSKETSTFNNATIKEFNSLLEKYAQPWGATYVDLSSILTNEQGALPESYSSDGYVHMTNTVYSYWANYFRKYATEHINDGLNP